MPKSAHTPTPPTCNHAGQETDNLRTTAQLTTQSLEDLHLAERIERALHATGHSALRAIEVLVNDRIVRLAGRVPSYYLKQIAQVTALAIPGTHGIDNDLDVSPEKISPQGGPTHGTARPQTHRFASE